MCHAASNPIASTILPKPSSKKPREATSPSISKGLKLGARRAKQRWSALVSAPTSRLAKYMRDRLGDALWCRFVRHANCHYKAAFVRAFCRPTLRCVGPLDGTACPHAFEVDLHAPNANVKLKFLHLDHERPVHLTCARWAKALPAQPTSWDDGIDGDALCHDLFGVRDDEWHGRRCLRFRCGPPGRFAQHVYCHVS